MTIFKHDILSRIVYGMGMFLTFALFCLALFLFFGVLKLPPPGDQSLMNVIVAIVVFGGYFFVMWGGGRLTVQMWQRFVRATCPQCHEREVVVVFTSLRQGHHRCRKCGYAAPE